MSKTHFFKWHAVFIIALVERSILERIHFSSPPEGVGLLRISRAFSTTLTGRFGMGTVRMCVEGRW
jgi:hypothetical protein